MNSLSAEVLKHQPGRKSTEKEGISGESVKCAIAIIQVAVRREDVMCRVQKVWGSPPNLLIRKLNSLGKHFASKFSFRQKSYTDDLNVRIQSHNHGGGYGICGRKERNIPLTQ